MADKSNLVVIGNGMVGQRLLELVTAATHATTSR